MKQQSRWRGILAYVLLAEGICLVVGRLYRLTFPWQMALCVILLGFLPVWWKNHQNGLLQLQRLSDAQIYMEQLLYAFSRQEKLLSAIADVLVLFPSGRMHDTLQKAVDMIRYDYEKEDVTGQALKLIEEEYRNERLITIHRFLYKVERIGGSYEGITTLLLRDLNEWRQRMDSYRKACKRERRNIAVAIGTAMVICMITNYLLPKQVDISGNVIQMASTVILIAVLLMVYTRTDRRLAVDWLRWGEEQDADKTVEQYQRYISYQEKQERKKSICMAVIPGVFAAAGFIISKYTVAVIATLCTIFLFYQHKIGHSLAKKNLKREIEKAFPHWLMELSLLLQLDNVQVSIAKTVTHAPGVLRPALEELLMQMEKTPESATPYLDFLKEFAGPQMQAAMKMLYALSMGNSGNEREQLEELIARNQNLMKQAEALLQEDTLAGMYLLFLAPSLAGGMKLMVDMTLFLFAFFTQSVV